LKKSHDTTQKAGHPNNLLHIANDLVLKSGELRGEVESFLFLGALLELVINNKECEKYVVLHMRRSKAESGLSYDVEVVKLEGEEFCTENESSSPGVDG